MLVSAPVAVCAEMAGPVAPPFGFYRYILFSGGFL
jgi:hypothetical protein